MADKTGFRAHGRFLLIAPSKVSRVATQIRRRPYPEAIAILDHLPHKGARMLKKVIESAAANALYLNKSLDEDMLYVKQLLVNEGPRYKRIWYRARGRADILRKRMSHITAVVDEIGHKGV